MIIALDHLIFGNGHGLKSPYFNNVFYWLSGEIYTCSYGLGAQLHSFQWTYPKPGERRVLAGREFIVYQARRRWCRVMVSWTMVGLPDDVDEARRLIRMLEKDLKEI